MQLDKNKIYEVGKYTYQNFTTLSEEQVKQIWEWRNHPDIRKYMYNVDEIPFESHLKFVSGLTDRLDVAYWIVCFKDDPIGIINLTSIDWEHSRAELGYYMVPEKMNSGLGIDFVYNTILFVFDSLHVSELFGSIHEDNKNAIILDSYMGCELGEVISVDSNSNAKYISWILNGQKFLENKEGKNNMRNFVRYVKSYNKLC